MKVDSWVNRASSEIARRIANVQTPPPWFKTIDAAERWVRETLLRHCPFEMDAAYVKVEPDVAYEKVPSQVIALLRESKRSHRHCEDSWYCCSKCDNADHATREAARISGVCNCGADAWNARVDAVLAALDAGAAMADGAQQGLSL